MLLLAIRRSAWQEMKEVNANFYTATKSVKFCKKRPQNDCTLFQRSSLKEFETKKTVRVAIHIADLKLHWSCCY